MTPQKIQQKTTLQHHKLKNTTTIKPAAKNYLNSAILQIRRKEALSKSYQTIRRNCTYSNKISEFPHKILLSKY